MTILVAIAMCLTVAMWHNRAASAATISVNFATATGGPHVGTSPNLVTAVTGVAGAAPAANWNNMVGNPQAVGQPLVDDTGLATGASITWSAPGVWSAGVTGTGGLEDMQLMKSYLDTLNDATDVTIAVTNIPYVTYDVYLYHSSEGGAGRRMSVTANGTTYYSKNLATAGTFNGFIQDQHLTTAAADAAAGGNYFLIENVSGSTLNLLAQARDASWIVTGAGTQRAPVQGIQIVGAIPEPSSLVLAGLGGLALAIVGLRRRWRAAR